MRGHLFAVALATSVAPAAAFLETVLTTAGSVVVSLIAGNSVKQASHQFGVDAARLVNEAMMTFGDDLGAASAQLGRDLITALGNVKVGLEAATLKQLHEFAQSLNKISSATTRGADVLATRIAAVSAAWQQVALSSQAQFYSFVGDAMTWVIVVLVAGTVAFALHRLRARDATSVATTIRLIALPTAAVSAAAVLLTAALQSAGASHVISLFTALAITFAGWWLADWIAADAVRSSSPSNAKVASPRAHAALWAVVAVASVTTLLSLSVALHAAKLSTSIIATPREQGSTANIGDVTHSLLPPELMQPGWLPLDGRKLDVDCPRQRLIIKAIGSMYLPDARGRTILGVGTGEGLSTRTAYDTGGAESVKLTVAEMPAHDHASTSANNHKHSFQIDKGGVKTAHSVHGTQTGSAGGNQPHENMPPWVALYTYVKV